LTDGYKDFQDEIAAGTAGLTKTQTALKGQTAGTLSQVASSLGATSLLGTELNSIEHPQAGASNTFEQSQIQAIRNEAIRNAREKPETTLERREQPPATGGAPALAPLPNFSVCTMDSQCASTSECKLSVGPSVSGICLGKNQHSAAVSLFSSPEQL
jgi:hypothetical protein